MRMPAYGRQLLGARAEGREFWLVVVAAGWLRDGDSLRGSQGVARIGCPADCVASELDWRCVIGMDVLVTLFKGVTRRFCRDVLDAVWRARAATLWVEDSAGLATRVVFYPALRSDPWTLGVPARVPMDAGFGARVRAAREAAMLQADEPFFSDRAFDSSREAVMKQWAA